MCNSLVALTVFTATSLIIQCEFTNCFPFHNNFDNFAQSNYLPEDEAATVFQQPGEASRKQRLAFPGIDVQESCPPGHVMHPSGKFCTKKDPGEDDYSEDAPKPPQRSDKSKQRKQRMPWTFAGFDVQESCPPGQVSGKHCGNSPTREDDYSNSEDNEDSPRPRSETNNNMARKQRFPGIDVQENCPPDYVMHPSGKFCTYNGDDYDEYPGNTSDEDTKPPKSDNKTRKQRLPWAGFDVQDNCPLGQVMHPSGKFCTHILTGEDDYRR